MRVLILSCNTGEGHNSTGKALMERCEQAGIACDMVNALSFAARTREYVICKGHVFIYKRMPKLYGAGYRYAQNHPPKHGKSIVYYNNLDCTRRLWRFISQKQYDTVVCVHVFPAETISAILRKHPGAFRSYFVATDYTCSPGVADADVDGFFIPHPDLEEEFIGCGVPADKLIPTGIPVAQRFCGKTPKAEARAILGLAPDGPIALLMCGSMGCGPMTSLASQCSARLAGRGQIVALCGNNHKLFDQFVRLGDPAIVPVGYTTQVDLYLDAADLLLTKAGGLTLTEAAVKELPILMIDAIPGNETKNVDFFLAHSYADMAASSKGLADLTVEYLLNPELGDRMRCSLAETFPKDAGDQMLQRLIADSPELEQRA